MFTILRKILSGPETKTSKARQLILWIKIRFDQKILGYSRITLNGACLKIRPRNYQLFSYLFEGNQNIFNILSRIIKRDSLFIDIGANIGIFSCGQTSLSSCEAVAIEPVRKTFLALCENIAANPHLKITPLRVAISNERKDVWITSLELSGINHLISEDESQASILTESVAAITLDSVTSIFFDKNKHRILVIKVDVERHEIEVLKGAYSTLRLPHPIVFCLEYFSKENLVELVEILNMNGFNSVSVNHDGTLEPDSNNSFTSYEENIIFANSFAIQASNYFRKKS